ncbi:hypothetical protein C484_10491 [Natrialba taiwanensis DSM 12281]|uniref:Uncharacterized protein n=1 Tax=Natrialba taiwanensis DSM 12281 TaxID=1230458 RepID=L9ZYQ6_9EURY|nr:hypothetical protein C484_10491 [Natrialba taiwanensis DSM 12281]
MNELQYIGTTESGNSKLMVPGDGHEFTFERLDYQTIRLHTVTTLPGVERDYDEFSTVEELPAGVRRVIACSEYRMRSTKTTLEGAMSHAD